MFMQHIFVASALTEQPDSPLSTNFSVFLALFGFSSASP